MPELPDHQWEQSIAQLNDRISKLESLTNQPIEGILSEVEDSPLVARVEAIATRMDALEKSDRLQSKAIMLVQRLQGVCFGVAALAFVGLMVSTPENKAMVERVAIGVIAAAATGYAGSGFLDETKKEE